MNNTIESIIQTLQLEKHCEGGYYRRTSCAEQTCKNVNGEERPLMTSINYFLTKSSPISYFATNLSNLILFHHTGAPLKILILDKVGNLIEHILGSDLSAGQIPHLFCPSGTCKAYDLMDGEYALISESVSPGFDYKDMHMPDYKEIDQLSNGCAEQLKKYIKKEGN
jgi:hypothetical protein